MWVREYLAAKWRASDARFRSIENGLKEGWFESPYAAMVAKLEAGRPFVTRAWQLPAGMCGLSGANDDCVVEADGRVALVTRRHVGDTVRYYRSDGSEVPP